MIAGFDELISAGIAAREAAALTGLSRATQHRRRRPHRRVAPPDGDLAAAPANKLSSQEEHDVLAVLHSDRFVDKPPAQIYATLLTEGSYLCSISTMYRILAKNAAARIGALDGVEIRWPTGFFTEFVVDFSGTGSTVQQINAALRERGIFGGKDLSGDFGELGQAALYCVTELHTAQDISTLVNALSEVLV